MIDEALDVLNNGLRYHPQYALAYLIMGKCFFDKRMFLEAKESFEKTLALDPQNIVALRMLAQTCELLQDRDGQVAAYRSILNLDPFDASAKENFDRLAAMQKKEPLYTVSMAQEYEKQNNLTKALEVYENLLGTNPADVSLQTKVNELKKTLAGGEPEAAPPQKAAEEVEPIKAGPREAPAEVPPVADEEKKPQAAEEVMSLEDFLAEESTEKAAGEPIPMPPEIPQPTPTAEEPSTQEPQPTPPTPQPKENVEPSPVEEAHPPQPKEPATEPQPAPPKPPEKKEESQKSKEEDFKSFQDWLSGLLK